MAGERDGQFQSGPYPVTTVATSADLGLTRDAATNLPQRTAGGLTATKNVGPDLAFLLALRVAVLAGDVRAYASHYLNA